MGKPGLLFWAFCLFGALSVLAVAPHDGTEMASSGTLTKVTFSGGCGKSLCPPEEMQLPIKGYFCDCFDFITDPHPECNCPGHEPAVRPNGNYCNPNVAGVRPGNCASNMTQLPGGASEHSTCTHDDAGCVSFDAAPTIGHHDAQVAPCQCAHPAPAPCECKQSGMNLNESHSSTVATLDGSESPTVPVSLKHLSIDFPAAKTLAPPVPAPKAAKKNTLLDQAQEEITALKSISFPTNQPTMEPKKVDCVVSEWSAWSPCSAECGPGNSTRTREETQPPANGGVECPHLEETKTCMHRQCPQDCQVGDWAPWSSCSKTCGEGTKTRTRRVERGAAWGGKPCPEVEETSKCKIRECSTDCVLSNWTEYGACDKTCGGGVKIRTRTVLQQPLNGGAPCGITEDKEKCAIQDCSVDCQVTPFGNWSACSVTCGGGVSIRRRSIIKQADFGGKACPELTEEKKCANISCVQDCIVSSWSVFGPCSKSCGSGTKVRNRLIKTAAANGGEACPNLEEPAPCNEFPCPEENITKCKDVKDELFNELEGAGREMLRNTPVAVFKQSAEISVKSEEELHNAVGTRGVWVYFQGDSIKLTKDLVLDHPGVVLDGRDRQIRISPDPSVHPMPKVIITPGATNVVIVGITFEGFTEVTTGGWEDGCGGAPPETCQQQADHSAILVQEGVSGLWIHRCRFTRSGRGVDFGGESGHAQEQAHGAQAPLLATISWSYFSEIFDSVTLSQPGELTVHHCFFDKSNRRAPKCGHPEGKLHSYNNVINNYGEFGAMSASHCELLLEHDQFHPTGKSGEAVECISDGTALIRESQLPPATPTRCQQGLEFHYEACKGYDYLVEFAGGAACATPDGCSPDVKKCVQNNDWADAVRTKTESAKARTCTLAEDGVKIYVGGNKNQDNGGPPGLQGGPPPGHEGPPPGQEPGRDQQQPPGQEQGQQGPH